LGKTVVAELLLVMARPSVVVHDYDAEGRYLRPEVLKRRDFRRGAIHVEMQIGDFFACDIFERIRD
jgi:hypothetical protein